MEQSKYNQLELQRDLEGTIALTMWLVNSLGMWRADGQMVLTVVLLVASNLICGVDVVMARDDLVQATKYACFFFAVLLPTLKMINFWLLALLITVMTFITASLSLAPPLVYMLREHRATPAPAPADGGGAHAPAAYPPRRQLPYPLYAPFGIDTAESPLFEVLYVAELILVGLVGLVISSFDNIYIIYVMNTAGHFRVLQNNIKLIGTNVDGGISVEKFGEETETRAYEAFSVCIKKHHLLLQFAEDLETIFTLTLLIQFSVSSLFLCMCGLQIVTLEGDMVSLLLFLSYFLTSVLQLFVYCWTCNEIVTTSSGVGDAVYACGWQRARGRGWREAVCLTVARAQRPAALTAGHFYPVTLETFTTILSTAGSYFTLLKTMMED